MTHALQVTYVMDRDIRSYDLSDPFQAFQFAVFLCRLRVYNEELQKRAVEKIDIILEDLKAGNAGRWRMPTT